MGFPNMSIMERFLFDRKSIYFFYQIGGTVSEAKDIEGRIAAADPGSVFVPSDFYDLAHPANAQNVLSRAVRSGALKRCARGVYCKPRFSSLLGEEVPPDVDSVARAIAKANGWAIVPSGNHALNMLGLDVQVPASFSYVSSGPYKEYDIDGAKVTFKHRASRDLVDRSYLTCLVIQALKALGKDSVDGDVIGRLAGRLSEEEIESLYEETRNATSWVFEAVKAVKEVKGA